jgi:non-canonical (house-cleaning) NTP pyrophosphatase
MNLTELTNLHIPVVVILGVNSDIPSSVRGVREKDAAANVVLYGKEIIQVIKNPLTNSISGLEKTETIVPPQVNRILPPFKSHHYPCHGDTVLLVIPTENEFKKEILQEYFNEQAPAGIVMHTITLPVDSGVGSQPYNEAGMTGAHTRLTNSLNHLDAQEYQAMFKEKRIGTIIVASIESYIQTDNIDRPTDYGTVVVHNATTQQTTMCTSQGVTVPPVYVNRARRLID